MMSMYFRKGIFNDRHGKTTHISGFHTRNVNVIASLYRNINNIALGTGHHGYCQG